MWVKCGCRQAILAAEPFARPEQVFGRRRQSLETERLQLGAKGAQLCILGSIYSRLLLFSAQKNESGASPSLMLVLVFVLSFEGEE